VSNVGSSEEYSLREPSLQRLGAFIRYRDSCIRHGNENWVGRHALANTDVASWIESLHRRARGEEIPEEWTPWVPETHFWIVANDEEIVGDIELRHPLTEVLRQMGGNIGYFMHPKHRRRGVASFALRSGLRILRDWGLDVALLTCRDDNIASIRTIEKAGGCSTRRFYNGRSYTAQVLDSA